MEQGDESPSSLMEQRKAAWENGELQREIVGQLITPEAIATMATAVQNLGAAFKQVVKPELFISIQTFVTRVKAILVSPELGQTIRVAVELGKATEKILNSPLLAYLIADHDFDLERLVAAAGESSLSVSASCEATVVRDDRVEQDIISHLESGYDLIALPSSHKNYLRSFIIAILVIFNYLALQSGVRSELCFFQPKLLPSMTTNQIGKEVRAFLCEPAVAHLRDYRVVTKEGVRLRASPGMKAAVVRVLPEQALLEVLDSSDRDWLHVAVVGQEGMEGWISRKYTHRLDR